MGRLEPDRVTGHQLPPSVAELTVRHVARRGFFSGAQACLGLPAFAAALERPEPARQPAVVGAHPLTPRCAFLAGVGHQPPAPPTGQSLGIGRFRFVFLQQVVLGGDLQAPLDILGGWWALSLYQAFDPFDALWAQVFYARFIAAIFGALARPFAPPTRSV